MDFWQYEKEALAQGHSLICGCDEAGAGPLAGPVYAAAVILPFGEDIPGLDDSKKLTEKKREALFPVIQERALAWSVAFVDAAEIDRTDILSARMKAMQLAIDGLSASIAAASILAKVSRDRFMVEMAAKYPKYRFDKHKGYGTRLHYELLAQHGPSPIHRKTFLRKAAEE